MKEKIKILVNEVDILRAESVAKDKALTKEHLEHQNAFYQRDALRAEMNKHMAAEKELKGQVAQLAAETDNLNALINGIEKEMLRLKKRYESAVEERNYTGIQLIDRNDELCILYEKSNMQQSVLKKGEIAIREREEEIRMLDLQVAELCREIEVTRRKLPRVPELEQEIVLLQTQLEEERQLGERLSAELEAPENAKRWRKLEGKDPEPEDLAAKLQVLEERVNDKKEQLLEKDLVLE
jgi:predicted RNase H-like nuclease (RuvC/YqgF family)